MIRAARAALVIFLLAVSGCLGFAAIGTDTCEDDSTCDIGAVCAFSFCIDPGALGVVDIEVEPLAASNLPVQSILDLDTDNDVRVDVALAPAVNVVGIVVDDKTVVPATVFALPTNGIAGRPRQRSATSSLDGFSMALVSGQSYRYAAVPESTEVPPAFPDEVFIAGLGGVVELRVEARQRVRGRIISGIGAAITGLDNCDVLIVDSNDRQLSTIAATDVEGRFSLSVGASSADAQLVVRPNNQYPAVRIPIDLGDDVDVDLGDRSLGDALITAVIAGRVRTASGAFAEGATVVVRGTVGNGIVTARQVTGRDGVFSLNVVRGSYVIAAVGVNDGSNGIVVRDVDVGVATVEGLVLDLPARVTARLEVLTAEGAAVASSSVVLTRIGDAQTGIGEPILVDAQPGFLGNTDERGRVSLAVDPGSYRIAIDPPRGQGTPAFSARLSIDSDVERTIILPKSKVVAGALRSGGNTVGGAFVRVYSQIVDERGKAILLGETFADADGAFAVSVPTFD